VWQDEHKSYSEDLRRKIVDAEEQVMGKGTFTLAGVKEPGAPEEYRLLAYFWARLSLSGDR
jgi:hypothetical protein